MESKLEFTCPSCSTSGTMGVPIEVDEDQELEIHVGGEIVSGEPCPGCGARLSWPGGDYVRNANGLLERVGDFTDTPRSAS